MKFLKIFCAMALIAAGIFACGGEEPVSEDGVFGAAITSTSPADFKTVVAELAHTDTVRATIAATVGEVCQKKGCWMVVNDGSDDHEIMVRFKDYGFFVPKDLAGTQVLIEGKAFKSVIPVDELRHYAEDAGKSQEEIMAITEPENSYNFEATGVRILNN